MAYLLVKCLHIISSTFLFGTGIGTAFYLLFASLSRDVRAVALVTRLVVKADWLFTGTTVIVQPATGWYLMRLAGYPPHSKWIAWSIGLYVLAVACWLPVVWLQLRLRDLAQSAASAGTPLPHAYWRTLGIWTVLGIPAFVALVLVYWLMVAKPV